MSFLMPTKKGKEFSSRDKIQKYHGDGTKTITMMGNPFRVIQEVPNVPSPYATRKADKFAGVHTTHLYVVENSRRISQFPAHFALKRSYFAIDEVAEAHREIEMLSRIKDKNIVRVYHSEVARSEGKLSVSVAMEHCPSTIASRMRSGIRMTEGEICSVLMAVTSAVGYLHSQQPPITHRAIRPENIMIKNTQTGADAYRLTDFSCATSDAYECHSREEADMAMEDIEQHSFTAFRAPEMADVFSGRRICEKSDMWSIGVLLYYLMYLKIPFEPTNMALANNPKVKFPDGSGSRYSGSLRVIIEHLLDPDPESRWDIFALTNFLRFDESVSCHLGMFCFSRTEWPDGWEGQDVKVLNRSAPEKEAPVKYDNPPPTKTTKKADKPAAAAANTNNNVPKVDDPSFQETIRMLAAGGDFSKAELEEMIKEQQAAWDAAKRASGATETPTPPPAESAQAAPKAAHVDVFDDLFAGPAAASSAPATADPFSQPAPGPVVGGSPPPAAAADRFNADDLFSAPPAPAPTNQGYYPPPQGQPPMNYGAQPMGQPMNYGGAPANYGGGAPAMAQPMSGAGAPWGMGAPMPPPNQANAYPPTQQYPSQPPPPPAQQSWPTAPAPAPAPKPKNDKKDPFADLFL